MNQPNQFIGTRDAHAIDRNWISLVITLKILSVYLVPIIFVVGPHFAELRLLTIGFEYGQTKPKSLIGGFYWNGNNKIMWSLQLFWMAYEVIRKDGIRDHYLY